MHREKIGEKKYAHEITKNTLLLENARREIVVWYLLAHLKD